MRRILVLTLAVLAAGCAGQNSQLATCQAEKDQLLATIRTQRETTRGLNEQVASLESRLDQAEKELARGGSGTRLSSRTQEPPATKSTNAPATTKTESLPWRSPAAKGTETSPQPVQGQRAGSAKSVLAELAKRERSLNYDSAAGTARIDLPLQFRDGGTTLSSADKLRLDEVSRLLRSEGARDLPIVIAGGSERGQAVADYLDRHGIADERLLVTANSPRGSRGTDQSVTIYLAGNDSALVAEAKNQAVKR
jgi:hypothetical protein